MQKLKTKKGFTLLEILLVIAAVGILAAIVLVAINPNKQLEAARVAKRKADINTIIKSIGQYALDNNGQYPVGIETGAKVICPSTNAPVGCIDLSILSPDYIAAIPDADTGYYYVRRNSAGTSIEVTHPKDNIWNTGGTPSLDLNFASNKSLIDTVSGNNLITFTRNSIGTYIGEDGLIKTAAINEPRFDHNPITKESLGLLVEEQRTNLYTYSQEFNTPQWSGSNLSTISNNTFSPEGLINASKIVENTTPNVIHMLFGSTVSTGAVTITASIYVKASERSYVAFGPLQSGGIHYTRTFNISEGTEVPGGWAIGRNYSQASSGTITDVGNGWKKISVTHSTATSFVGTRLIILNGPPNNINNTYVNYTGDGTSGIYIWGAQLEQGAFPTSYIPTSGASVARNTDDAFIMGTNFTSIGVSPNTGTLFSQGIFPFAYNNGNSSLYFSIDNNSVSNELALRSNIAHTQFAGNATINNTALNSIVGVGFGSIGSGQLGSIALAYNTGNSRVSANGVLGGLSSTPFSAGTFDIARIGSSRPLSPTQYMNGTIRRVMYWNTRLADNILQSITQ